MPEGKKKFIGDCARLIEKRVELLEEELARDVVQYPKSPALASDRAAIMEAQFLAKLIRSLADGPYVSHPYDVARGRVGWGKKVY